MAWQWAKGVAAPIVGATKSSYLEDAAGALSVSLTDADLAFLTALSEQLTRIRQKALYCWTKRNKELKIGSRKIA